MLLFYHIDCLKKGYKYFFIDEITYAESFQSLVTILSDDFVSDRGAKIKSVDKAVKIMAVAGSLRVNLLRFTRNGVHSHDLVRLTY